ncbi:MAG: type II toxin-antitoxin system VapC family toxin [Vicinamibacterales bacterium]
MKFWDSSAIVPLLAEEPKTAGARELYLSDAEVVVWWATPVECASALARLERDGGLEPKDVGAALRRLDALARSWIEVEPHDELRETARRFLRVHPLRAADALQLAAAYLAAERRPPTLTMVTIDDRLQEAAAKEGFVLADL